MRPIALATNIAVLFAGCSGALANDCRMVFHHIFLQPLNVEFVESASGGRLTLRDTALDESIVFELDRQVLTSVETDEQYSALVGSEIISSGRIVNNLKLLVWDKRNQGGTRVFGITSNILIEGFSPQEQLLSGTLVCPG